MAPEPRTGTRGQNFGNGSNIGQVMPFESIDEPGTYVCNWSEAQVAADHVYRTSGISDLRLT